MKKIYGMGSVSSGTMREEDLIPAFVDELEYMDKRNHTRKHSKLIKEIKARMVKPDYYGSDDSSWDLNEELFNALQEYCYPYFYFGSHPGDGSDYGYWLSDTFEYDFDGLKISDLNELPKGYTGEVLLINERGNMTLYKAVNGRLYEIWSIV